MNTATDYGRARAAECAALLGLKYAESDPVGRAWNLSMNAREKTGWCAVAKVSERMAEETWGAIPERVRDQLSAVIRRAAARAAALGVA